MTTPRHLTVLLAAVLFISCSKPYHEEIEVYYFVAPDISSSYWQEAQAGFMDAAGQLGVKAEFTGPDFHSPDEQLNAFRKVMETSSPAGILISPTRPETFEREIRKAVASGIPIICVGTDAPDSGCILFVGTDDYQAGLESGRRIAELLHGGGSMILITVPGHFNLEERLRGVNEALKKYPEIKITRTLDDKGDPRSANNQISTLLESKEKINGILCLEVSCGSGAAEALDRLGVGGKIPIVAMDKNSETLDWISRGVISATIAPKPYTMGFYGLKMLDDLHHNAVHEFKDWRTAPVLPLPRRVDTGTVTIDISTLAAFRSPVASIDRPSKLSVQSQTQTIRRGEPSMIDVILLDVDNRPVGAPKETTVEIATQALSGGMERKIVVRFEKGESSKRVEVPIEGTGIVEIRASQRELLDGSTFVNVKPKPELKPGASMQTPRPLSAGAELLLSSIVSKRDERTVDVNLRTFAEANKSASTALVVMLLYSPQRPLLANGKDPATIQAFLVGEKDIAPEDIRIGLFNTGGTLDPKQLLIPRGQNSGSCTLTADQVGTVNVMYLWSSPTVNVQGEKGMQVTYAPAITHLGLKADPPEISLADEAEVIVRLLDDLGKPTSTDQSRHISFSISEGRAEINPKEFEIQAQSSERRTKFVPTWLGKVTISAFTPNLPETTTALEVTLPGLLMFLSVLGGGTGGFVGFLFTGKKRNIVIGLITGFLLYWASLLFGIVRVVPRPVILNPLSTCIFSILGGWLGIGVFSLIIKGLGLIIPPEVKPS